MPLLSLVFMAMSQLCSQGRRHGFESGGTNSASEASRKFVDPNFLASGGTKYCL